VIINVPAHEAKVVRLFAIDLTADEIIAFRDPVYDADGNADWALKKALGATLLDEDFIEVFHIDDLGELGLAGYLTDGVGIPADQVAAHYATLSALKGFMLLITSAAFDGFANTLEVKPPLRHVATLNEDSAPVKFETLPDGGAKGALTDGKPPKSDARIGGMIAMYVLVFLFALVGLMIWIAG